MGLNISSKKIYRNVFKDFICYRVYVKLQIWSSVWTLCAQNVNTLFYIAEFIVLTNHISPHKRMSMSMKVNIMDTDENEIPH
jgi:hypothetical protein